LTPLFPSASIASRRDPSSRCRASWSSASSGFAVAVRSSLLRPSSGFAMVPDPLLLLALAVRCVVGNIPSSTPHVVESTAVGSKPPCLPLPSLAEVGGIEEASRSGCLDGRSSAACLDLGTESLGFESCCDERMGAEERQAEQEICQRIEEYKRRPPSGEVDDDALQHRKGRSMRRRKTQAKEFPPPIPLLGVGGHSSSFLKVVKSDGRLVLTEVRVERPEILRASRRLDEHLTLETVSRHACSMWL
ncbi:hypothetical protein Taro_016807, partial [Colocasia esculenta]|nr:hypothetical protein [Colocasia esculenta]